MTNACELRLALWRCGFAPLPLEGKNPNVNGADWQRKRQVTNEREITLWNTLYPLAHNTGVLTLNTPFLDLDILDPDAAAAAEQFIKDRFDGHHVLTRIGKWPKRAFPFQTLTPFKKISVDLVSPDGTQTTHEKIELLCDGQQCVVAGIHPDTQKPYAWHGGDLTTIHHDELPGIDEESGRALVDALADLVCRYGYRRKLTQKGNGAGHAPGISRGIGADWHALFANAIDHDQLTASAAALVRAGLDDGACVNLLRAAVDAAPDADGARRARRQHEIPAMVASARALVSKPGTNKPAASKEQTKIKLQFGHHAMIPQSMGTIVQGLLHAGSLTLMYGPPKSGKSFLLLSLFLAIAAGDEQWFGHPIIRAGPVLYIACEGHAGFWKRLRAEALHRGWTDQTFPGSFVLGTGRPQLIQINNGGHAVVPNPQDIINAVDQATAAGCPPVAVAVDTVFRSFGGGNVNAADHMNAYLQSLGVIQDRGIATAAVHHETKSGGTPAGSVTLIGGVDNLVNTASHDDGSKSWHVEMAKDDATTEPKKFTLKVQPVGRDPDGNEADSCYVETASGPVPRKVRKMSAAHEDFYNYFKQIMREHGAMGCPLPGMQPVRSILRSALRKQLTTLGYYPDHLLCRSGEEEILTRAGATIENNSLTALKIRGLCMFNREWVWQI